MDKVQELYDLLGGIKRQIRDNVTPEGDCRFNFEHIKTILAVTKMTLEKSVEEFKME